jgi:hypothetical protein
VKELIRQKSDAVTAARRIAQLSDASQRKILIDALLDGAISKELVRTTVQNTLKPVVRPDVQKVKTESPVLLQVLEMETFQPDVQIKVNGKTVESLPELEKSDSTQELIDQLLTTTGNLFSVVEENNFKMPYEQIMAIARAKGILQEILDKAEE